MNNDHHPRQKEDDHDDPKAAAAAAEEEGSGAPAATTTTCGGVKANTDDTRGVDVVAVGIPEEDPLANKDDPKESYHEKEGAVLLLEGEALHLLQIRSGGDTTTDRSGAYDAKEVAVGEKEGVAVPVRLLQEGEALHLLDDMIARRRSLSTAELEAGDTAGGVVPSVTIVLPGAFAHDGPFELADTSDYSTISGDLATFPPDNNNSGLVEAMPVEEPEDLMEAQPVLDHAMTVVNLVDHHGHQQQAAVLNDTKDKRCKILVCGIIGLSVCCFVLLMSINHNNNNTNNNGSSKIVDDVTTNHSPISGPMRPVVSLPPMVPQLELLYDDLPAKTKKSLSTSDNDSPQYKAWEWLMDHPNLTTYPEWRKKQIFSMATLYYSFEGPNWPKETPSYGRWMDINESECSWVMSDEEVAHWSQASDTHLGAGAHAQEDIRPCNEDGRLQTLVLRQLFLPAADLRPTIPPQIGLLTSLRGLSILFSRINAKLSDLLVPELIQLSSVETINFQASGIHGTIPTNSLSNMTSLRHLIIGDNELSGTIPSELGLLTSTTVLVLSRNRFEGAIPRELGLLTGSKIVSISNLPTLKGNIPNEFFIMMPNLTKLILSGSPNLAGTIPDQACSSISELDFDCSDLLCGCDCQCGGVGVGSTFNNKTN